MSGEAQNNRAEGSDDEGWWNYSINYGPDGEENYANVYTPTGEFVGNLKIHHARQIVGGLNDVALAAAPKPEPASAVLDETRAFRAAEKANTQFGQWMPERWLHLFIKAYGEGQ